MPTYSHIYNGELIEFNLVEDALVIEKRNTVNKGVFASAMSNIEGIINLHPTVINNNLNTSVYKVESSKREFITDLLSQKHFVERITRAYKANGVLFIGTGKLIIIPKSKMTKEAVEEKCQGFVVDFFENFFLIDYRSDRIVDEVIYPQLKDEDWIKHIEKDFSTFDSLPLQSTFRIPQPIQNLNDLPEQKAFAMTKTYEAHTLTTGSSTIKIAILDCGVDIRHLDLKSQTEEESCWDFILDSNYQLPMHSDFHGTCCAGLAVAKKYGQIGIDGVGKGCKLISYRIGFNDTMGNFQINLFSVLKAILSAGFKAKADVINCSWNFKKEFNTLAEAIKVVSREGRNNKGTVFVFSAGNEGRSASFPANMEEVITVSAVNELGIPLDNVSYSFPSNYGDTVDIAAPGTNLVTTDILDHYGAIGSHIDHNNYFKFFGATSGAAPQVAGCVGLMLSVNPSLTSKKIKEIIINTKIDFPSPPLKNYGAGIINVYKAVQKAKQLI